MALAGYGLLGIGLLGAEPVCAQTLVTGSTPLSGTIDGNNNAGFYVNGGGTLTINNGTVQNFTTIGGSGSGGGAGFGGAIFVNSGGAAILNGVNFSHNGAVGGNAVAGAVAGGTLNNGVANGYLTATGNGVAGANGIAVPDNSIQFGDGKGNGIPGVFAGNAGNATNGFGGTGGVGGAGTNGWSSNPVAQENLSIANEAVATATMMRDASIAQLVVHSVFAAAEIIGTPLIGADPLSGAGDKFAYGMTIARGLGDIAFSAVGYVGSEETLAQAQRTQALSQQTLNAWHIAAGLLPPAVGPTLSQSLVGNGGNGQNGGNASNGTFGFGGGAGGQGGAYGLGGTITLSGQTANTTDGTGGNGGAGGAGGFGAGGGSGGYGFGAGQNGGTRGSTSGSGGAGGAGGFGGGVGSTGGVTGESGSTGGGGGQGYGGAIFVNSGGSLTLTGNATFTGNNAVGGASLNGGQAGTGAGTDIFMMTGSTVRIAPGGGNTITFNGSIADNSISSIGASASVGSGAGLTIYAGTTVFNGANTYSGQTVIAGNALSGAVNTATNTTGAPDYNTTAGALRAQDGVGLPTNSNLNFAGPTMFTGGVLETNGVFNRWVGTNSNRVQWTGSGGFAAVDGPLTITLNEYRPGMGTQLSWGAGNFVGFGSSLMFGSANSTHAVTFNNAIKMTGGYGAIMVVDNGNAAGSTATMAGILSGTGGLIVNGGGYNGTLNLGAANTYTGATLINSGNLALTGAGSIANSAGIGMSGGTLDISGTTSGASIQTLASSGGAGNVALGSKTLTITAGFTTFTGVIADGGISGGTGGGLTVVGGTQTLAGTNTYTGATTINGGSVLALSGTGSIATSWGVTVNNGTFDISQTTAGAGIKTLSGAANVALGGKVLSITAGSTTFSGVIANGGIGGGTNGSLNITGGTQTLTGTNTFTGSTNINPGSILALVNSGSIATSSVIQSNGTLDISQTTAGASITALMGTGEVALGGKSLSVTNGLANIGFAGNIRDGGIGGGAGGNLIIAGGTQNLMGANSYTGVTSVNIGANLSLLGSGAIASSSVVVANGTLDISNTSSGASIKTLAGLGSVALGGQPLTITAGSTTFSGVISGSGSINVTGGTQVLDYNTNTYTGATTISSGATLALNSTASIAASSGVANNGTLNIATTTAGASITTLSGNGAVTLGAQTLTLTSAHDAFGGVVSGTGGLTVAGGAEVLTGVNTYTGATTVNAGAGLGLSGAGSVATSSVVNANGLVDISNTTSGTSFTTLAGNGGVNLGTKPLTITNGSTTFAGTLYGTGGLTIAGGTETLSGGNTYTGQTTINSGATLALSGVGSIASSSAVANSGTFSIADKTGNATITTLSGNGSVALGGNGLVISNGAAGASGTNPAGTFSGTIGGTGLVGITGGYQNLTGVNTYSGGTVVQNATLGINSNASLGAATGGVTLVNGVIVVNGNVTANRPTDIYGANTINTNANAVAWNGSITGTGSLNVTGGGTLSLTGMNTFAGGMIVAYGTNLNANATTAFGSGAVTLVSSTGSALNLFTGQVYINGQLSVVNGAVPQLIIAAGDTISGTGTINVSTLVQGQLAPGNSPGTLTWTAPVALASNATTRIEIDGPTSSVGAGGAGRYDTTQVVGAGNTFTAGGTLNPVLRGISGPASNTYTPAVTTSFTIVQAEGGVLGSFSSINQPASGLAAGTRFDALYFPTSIGLYVTPADYRNLSAFNVTLNTNQSNVAGAINALRGEAGPVNNAAATRELAYLYAQQPGSLPRAFNTLSGEAATGARVGSSRMMNQYMALTTDSGAGSGQAAGAGPGSGMMGLGMGERSALGGPSTGSQGLAPGQVSRWSGWGSAFGTMENRNGNANTGTHNLSAGIYGLATGAFYRFGDNMLAGFSIAAGNSKWSLAENLGSGRSDSYMASLYGRMQLGSVYLAVSGAIGTHGISTTRTAFTGEQIAGKLDAHSYGGRAEAGYTLRAGSWSLSPYAAFQSQVFDAPGYTETGGFALAFQAESATTNRSEIGARVEARTTVGSNMPLYLRARAAWVHDFSSSPAKLATFASALQPGAVAGANSSFSVNGTTLVQDAALISFSAELGLTPYISIGASLDGAELSRGAQAYGGSGSVRIQW